LIAGPVPLAETLIGNLGSTSDPLTPSPLNRLLLSAVHEALRRASRTPETRDLRMVAEALGDGAIPLALRRIDRLWRSSADSVETIAPLYACLLFLEGRDHHATLGMLQRALALAPNPDIAALAALTLLRLERYDAARERLERALRDCCVVPGGVLFNAACTVSAHPSIGSPGWIGRGPELQLLGELSREDLSSALDIRIGEQAFSQLLSTTARERGGRFSIPCPPLSVHEPLEVQARGVALLGSGGCIPADFGLDGRSRAHGRQLSGWVRIGWQPARAPRTRIEDEAGNRVILRTAQLPLPTWRWPFSANARKSRLKGARFRIEVQLPDGCWCALADSPLLLESAVRDARRTAPRLPQWRPGPASRKRTAVAAAPCVDIIIPVYRGLKETLACIDSVLGTTGLGARVLVVDDATPDPELAAALDTLASQGRINLVRNFENLGFVGSVNRALALNPTHDAVLLNSDTLVFGDWLERLRATAYSARYVGTVTPLTNNGSIAGYPHATGTTVTPSAAAALHTFATLTHPGASVEIPVGVGFCLYVRRDCLREVGELDAAVFGKGYGEETDFCLRARLRGWTHRLAGDVYVYHGEGVSFGSRREALLERSNRLINLRYPGYDRFIASFQAQDPIRALRHRLDEHRLSALQARFVLIVTLAMTGGVDRYVAERRAQLRAQGLFTLVLKPAAAGDRDRCELWTDAMDLPNLRYHIPRDLAALTGLLRALRLEAIEIQHFLHLDNRVIEAVRTLQVPYDVFVHDYAWICPRVTLIDGRGTYCGEPAVAVCQSCVRRNGSQLGEAISVASLRARSATWLRGARRVLAPSQDTAERLQRHFTDLSVQVQPHSSSIMAAPLAPRASRSVVRVALIGAIGDHKGYQELLACARDARARSLPLEFVVVGYTVDDGPLLSTGKVFVTGQYADEEAPHLLEREHPDIAWFPSVWPETWCYALDYALAAGIPILAFDLGAIAERIRGTSAAGRLVPLGHKPGQINDALLQLGGLTSTLDPAGSCSVQSELSRESNDANMILVLAENITMNKTPTGKASQEAQDESLSASVKVLPLPAGLYLFSVKAAGKAPPRLNGQLTLPAVHVGLGPGVHAHDVEFVTGPNTHGAWLFAQGDLLVTKVNGAGATLIMTSLRAPGGDVLSIKVEKLENRAEAAAVASDAPVASRARSEESAQVAAADADDQIVPVHVAAHVRARGDLTFDDVPWAGRIAPGLWIESYSVRPMRRLKPSDIEYKGLTGSGFETPWLTDEKMCGTKGMAVPLVGFAVRLKPSAATADYDCEYSGYFQSGATVGPLRNGAPCRSTVANDPLEGLQIRLLKRAFAATTAKPELAVSATEDDADADAEGKTRRQPGRPPQSPARRPTRRS
jgi:GT2 family glycosyltransferase